MKRITAFIMLMILGMSLVTVAIAENNTTADITVTGTVASTAVPIVTQVGTQPVQTLVQPVQTEKKFRIGPTVRIRPVNDIIKKDQDGLVEIYFDNSGLNDYPLTVEAKVSVPSGIHVSGQGFGSASAAGIVSGTFEIPPGSARTINVVIKAEKIGDFSTQFIGTYYPGDNKDAFQPISLTHPFTVLEASADPLSGGDPAQTGKEGTKSSPGMTTILAIFAITILAYTMRKK
jgi:hypothetical protein